LWDWAVLRVLLRGLLEHWTKAQFEIAAEAQTLGLRTLKQTTKLSSQRTLLEQSI
jgi:hypothetical protein